MGRINIKVSGGCQCGAVRFRATPMLDNAHICHCRMCQKAVGNFFAALVAAPNDALTFTRGTPSVFLSSEHVQRGFCAKCGTPLFYKSLTGKHTTLTIGSLDNPRAFPPKLQDGVESRLPYFASLHAIESETTTEHESEAWAAAIKASSRQHPDHDTDVWPPKNGVHHG
ncbi:MAG: GFA family protein [Cucumibacter sp.]